MNCKKCNGNIDQATSVNLCTYSGGVHCVETFHKAFPCEKCGLLHWDNGDAVARQSTGEYAYLEDGKVVAKKEGE